MIQSFGQLNIHAYQPHQPEEVVVTRLFEHEEMRAELAVLPPHSAVPVHAHPHAHELLDVVEGEGTFWVDGIEFPGGPGKCVLVTAGTPHALRNDSDQPWAVRITYQQRVYARQVGKLVRRAMRKRLGLER